MNHTVSGTKDNFRVIVASDVWLLSGVNVFATHLVRGLRALGISAEILLTIDQPLPSPADIELQRLPIPPDLSWRGGFPLRRRWAALLSYLEERAPCIYIPNSDYYHSCVCSKLSNRVAVVGIVHSDDPDHYEHVGWLGKYWDAVVAVSKTVEDKTARLNPTLRSRLWRIPYGIPIPARCPERPERQDAALRIIFPSRLVQLQKRVMDLPGIVAALAEKGVPFRLTVAGAGQDQDRLLAELRPFLADGRAEFKGVIANEDLPRELEQQDVSLMTSDFEGLPLALMEAMGRGCVPVVTDIPSGLPELVQDGVNGYRVPVGDLPAFADRLAMLQRDASLRRQLSQRAYEAVSQGGYRVEDMVHSYVSLFRRVLDNAASGAFHRPRGPIVLPPRLQYLQPTWKDWLPDPVRSVASRCRRMLRRTEALQQAGKGAVVSQSSG